MEAKKQVKPQVIYTEPGSKVLVNGKPLKYRIGDSARGKKEKQEKQQ
jgi:hypothetical protein